ncbi:MAG: thiol:disulfide interchange protein DsbA/DsbL [Ectothiorhodospiraceae bacterium]|nr:thiol:disulfide interchange protein DsbA/DsbL [Ectothiorhodospiraceae bacterium]MCH8505974.1 thiol:disulfide interchange protein DsbA/DsbL [Ectothiorhodospiraceae bacterium]
MRVMLGVVIAAGLLLAGAAQGQSFQAGTHYRELPRQVDTVDDGRIEVREFFSYGCPFCNQFLPRINSYAEQVDDDVVVVKHPVVFDQRSEPLARAYAVAEELGVVDDVHGALFVAYHERGNRLDNAERVAEVFAEQGVDRQAVIDEWESFGVETKVSRYRQNLRNYMATSTPSMAVNGRYYIDMNMARSQDQLLQIVDYLVQKERDRIN